MVNNKSFIDRSKSANYRLVDGRFEELLEQQYLNNDEEENEEEADEAQMNETPFLSMMEEQQTERTCKERFPRELPDSELKEATLRYANALEDCAEKGQNEQMEDILVDSAKKSRWDCETILTMHSTIYNHPTEIKEPMKGIGKRKGKRRMTEKCADKSEEMEVDDCEGPAAPSVCTRISIVSSIRPKGETTEERRLRKNAVKEERRERRKEKKVNKETFQAERLKLEAQRKTTQPRTRPIH